MLYLVTMQYNRSDYLRLVQYRRALYAKGVRTVAKEAVLNNDALSPYYIAKVSRFERFKQFIKKLIIFLAHVISSANRLVAIDGGRYHTVQHPSIINQYTDYFVSHILKNYTASKRQRVLRI